ncbi:MAG TPA: hypothetical protein VIT67_17705 [Povalibacter sp.]
MSARRMHPGPNRVSIVVSAAALLTISAGAHAHTSAELEDAAARIQYAFYTADTRELEQVLSIVSGLDAPVAGMKEYYGAYGNWKLSQLYARTASTNKAAARGAGKASQECERQAKAAVALDARMAEAYALEAICSGAGTGLMGGSCVRSKPMRTALELEPQNPRIRLIELLCRNRDEKGSVKLQDLRELVAAFEASPSRPGRPDWGQAEALVLLGESYLQRGDSVAARDATERALVVAPDYREAQELLQAAAARPR